MAQRIITQLIDDLDGGEAVESVHFGLDGSEYEIDLSLTNAESLRKAMATYTQFGRRVSGGRTKAPREARRDLAKIRDWAKDNGIRVSERGRIASSIIAEYDAAQENPGPVNQEG